MSWWMSVAWAVEPFPVTAAPVPVVITAFTLPKADPAWITDEAVFEYTCAVSVASAPGSGSVVTPDTCPEAMQEAFVAAAASWVVEGPAATWKVSFVAKYSPVVRAITVHAQVDPGLGEAEAGRRGPPGVKLVHPAARVAEVAPRLSAKVLREVPSATCAVHLWLDEAGRPAQLEVGGCPEAVIRPVEKAASKWRYTPRYVDGAPVPVEVLEHVVVGAAPP